jgi:mRNA-degrading endonuclease RelE of RelBE toxin-antitoxin system
LANWKLQFPKGFHRFVKGLGPIELKKFERLLKDLEDSIDPSELAEYKNTKGYGRCFVANIPGSCRLAFDLDFSKHVILLFIIGDHKDVYGKD